MAVNLIFLGPPGTGKGTVSDAVKEKYGLIQLSTGDIIRNLKNKPQHELTESDKIALECQKTGVFVPDAIVTKLLEEKYVSVMKAKNFHGVIFDGYPRNTEQAKILDGILERYGQKLSGVVHIESSEASVVERLSNRRSCPHCKKTYNLVSLKPKKEGVCDLDGHKLIQREDDNPKVVRDRFQTFLKETNPLVAYYKKRGILHGYDGNVSPAKSIAAAEAIIQRIIASKASAKRVIRTRRPLLRKRVSTKARPIVRRR